MLKEQVYTLVSFQHPLYLDRVRWRAFAGTPEEYREGLAVPLGLSGNTREELEGMIRSDDNKAAIFFLPCKQN